MAASPESNRMRLLPRIVNLLLQRTALFSSLCYLAGVAGILLLPAIAKETYVDENALSPGMAASQGRYEDVQHMLEEMGGGSIESIQSWVLQQLDALGVDSCIHHFPKAAWPSAFVNSNLTEAKFEHGRNVIGIVRAPRGEGNECLVFITPLSMGTLQADRATAVAAAMSFGIFRHLATVPWLAKDLFWVVPDVRYGADYAVSHWLADYYSPSANTTGHFLRGGAIQAAVALQVDPSYQSGPFDLLELRTEGPNGEMPNMDTMSTITFLNRYQPTQNGLRFEIARWEGLSSYLGPLLPLLRWATDVIGRASGLDYDRHLEMLAGNMHRQAVGLSTGVHGAFRRYTVDALTLVAKPTGENRDLTVGVSKTKAAAARRDQALSILKLCNLLESTLRCFNNLLERFHHSVFLYVLASPTRFVSIAEYMIPFALLLISLPLTAASLSTYGYTASGELEQDLDRWDEKVGKESHIREATPCLTKPLVTIGIASEVPVTLLPANWTAAGTTVTAAHLGGTFLWQISPLLLRGTRHVFRQLHLSRDLICAAMWAASALVVLTAAVTIAPRTAAQSLFQSADAVHKLSREEREEAQGEVKEARPQLQADWVALKSITLAAAGLALGALVNLDYALALLSAVSLVPLCLLAQPLQKLRICSAGQNLGDEVAAKRDNVTVEKAESAEGLLPDTSDIFKERAEGARTLNTQAAESETPGLSMSSSQLEERTPSMASLSAQVRKQFAQQEKMKEEGRARSKAGRLRSAVRYGVSWVLDRRRALREGVTSGRGARAEQRQHSRQSVAKRVAVTAGALLVSAMPFLVLIWEQGEGPSLQFFVAKLDAPLADSIAMGWLVVGYLPIVALCVRILCS